MVNIGLHIGLVSVILIYILSSMPNISKTCVHEYLYIVSYFSDVLCFNKKFVQGQSYTSYIFFDEIILFSNLLNIVWLMTSFVPVPVKYRSDNVVQILITLIL